MCIPICADPACSIAPETELGGNKDEQRSGAREGPTGKPKNRALGVDRME